MSISLLGIIYILIKLDSLLRLCRAICCMLGFKCLLVPSLQNIQIFFLRVRNSSVTYKTQINNSFVLRKGGTNKHLIFFTSVIRVLQRSKFIRFNYC